MPTKMTLSCFCLFSLIACSKTETSKVPQRPTGQVQREQIEVPEVLEGKYHADIRPLNNPLSGEVNGFVDISVHGEHFVVVSSVNRSHPETKHFQSINYNKVCPSALASDLNNDSVIDAQEGLSVYGPVLVPLDSNLDSQSQGINYGPISNESGSYVYKRSTQVSVISSDLRDTDFDDADMVTKLPSEEEFLIEGRAVVVYGVSSTSQLPEGVASATLPIACGVLKRVK